MVGSGTTIDVAKRMGRRVWASDWKPHTPTLPIHQHDITTGWPEGAPSKVDFIFLDPPYWQPSTGKHNDSGVDLGNQALEEFLKSWPTIIHTCKNHLAKNGELAFIISPTQTDD